jgi:Flp pilus assembly protein TadG
MNYWKKCRLSTLLARQDGSVAVEFVILFPLFVLVLMGIMEFGHLWYVDHVITNASREGARAAVVYEYNYDPYDDRQTWAKNKATEAVNSYLTGKLPGVDWEATPTATGNNSGGSVTMTIKVSDAALILNLLGIPGFNPLSLTAATTMRME